MRGWDQWEVFVRSQHGLAYKHIGSVHAADAEMALTSARDVYTRRNEGVSIWVVKSNHITASDPAERDAMFGPAGDKNYRYATYYAVPDGVENL